MKTALVLEGGAMRGIYTAGVIDILLENNIKVDFISLFSARFTSKESYST